MFRELQDQIRVLQRKASDLLARVGLIEPPGTLTPFAGSTAPTGWLLCDGSAISRTEHPALFAVIGTTYGTGNGSTTFNLPNTRGRTLVGRDTSDADFTPLGKTGGTKTNTHNHYTGLGGDHTSQFKTPTAHLPRSRVRNGVAGRSTWAANSGTGNVRETSTYNEKISVIQPYLTVNYLIKT